MANRTEEFLIYKGLPNDLRKRIIEYTRSLNNSTFGDEFFHEILILSPKTSLNLPIEYGLEGQLIFQRPGFAFEISI